LLVLNDFKFLEINLLKMKSVVRALQM